MSLLKTVLLTSAAVILTSAAPIAPAALTVQQQQDHSLVARSSSDPSLKVSPKYDPDHSQHWNYRHGYVNKDGHGHGMPHRRSSEDDEDDESFAGHEREMVRKMEKRHQDNKKVGTHNKKGSSKKGPQKTKKPITAGKKIKGQQDHDLFKATAHLLNKDVVAGANLAKRSPHSEHWKEHHHLGEDHKHEHEHEHVHEHIHEHSRRALASDDADLETRGGSSAHVHLHLHKHNKESKNKHEHDHTHEHKKEHGHSRRSSPASLAVAGVPGFVEVASPLFNSSLARSIAGLVFTSSQNTSDPGSDPVFSLGTSTTQSTQFYLVQSALNSTTTLPAGAQALLNVVQIRLPVLNSQSLMTEDYCATFDLAPPSPMSLAPCGEKKGFSQDFAYNSTTGELKPLYGNTPAPMALVQRPTGEPGDDSNSSATAEASSTTMTASSTATDSSATSTATESMTSATSTDSATSSSSTATSSSDSDSASSTSTDSATASSSSTSDSSAMMPSATVKHTFAMHNTSTTSSSRVSQADDSSSSAAASPASSSSSDEDDNESISLYFVPASAYYQAPSFVSSLVKQAPVDDTTVQDGADQGVDASSASATDSSATATATATASATDSASVTATATPLSTMTMSASSDSASATSTATSSATATDSNSTDSSSSSTDSASATATPSSMRRAKRTVARW